MKTMKLKSIFALILFSILILGSTSIASAVTRLTSNGFEDSFPKTAGGYVVWQGQDGNDWEIFLYNANDGTGPFQITDNTYGDVYPEIDGNYVTWAAGAAPYGEIFLYDISTLTTTRLTDNAQYDHNPKVVDGMVVWVSHSDPSVDVEAPYGPGDIVLYNIAEGVIYNISALVDPDNIHDDSSFRFDGNRIVWGHENKILGLLESYVYELATGSIYRYITPEDDNDPATEEISYLEDLATGETYLLPDGLGLHDNPQAEGDFYVFTRKIGGNDREIMIRDLQVKRGGQITDNDIEDIQPAIKDNIVVWKGGEGNSSEIYLYEIQPLFADAGYDFELDIDNVDKMVIQGKAGGGALQYRWLKGGIPLADWQQVVAGQAPIALANIGFTSGPQTLTLEVTDGNTVVSDQVTMDLQDWYLEPISPADNWEQLPGIYPEFTWSSSPFNTRFKIQISQTAEFLETETVTYPGADDGWMIRTISFFADEEITQLLDTLLSASQVAYWRIVTQDRYGIEKKSDVRSFIITPTPDNCPNDPDKTEPGICGCGVADTDSNNDGIANCIDSDNDGLSDINEDINQNGIVDEGETDPYNPDSDNDGLSDGVEDKIGTNPLLMDSDGNGILDCDEDHDGDGFTNFEEVQCNSDPGNPESKCVKFLPFLMLLLD